MSSGYPSGKNPFFTDDDDCVGFGSSRPAGSRPTESRPTPHGFRDVSDDEFSRPVSTKVQQLQTLKEESMSRQLDSTQRALASIYDSERMGVATAEELLHQGEQLDNIEAKTDAINEDMKISQRHLNSIKSVFGGIKNWWSGGDKKDVREPAAPRTQERQSRLQGSLDTQRQNESQHPALRLRAEDVRGFYDDDSGPSQGAQQQQKQVSSGRAAYDQQFNQNLDMMSDGMSRLKNLAMGLGDEIETQNEQLDRINDKVDRADISIQDKNKQMRQILGVKKK